MTGHDIATWTLREPFGRAWSTQVVEQPLTEAQQRATEGRSLIVIDESGDAAPAQASHAGVLFAAGLMPEQTHQFHLRALDADPEPQHGVAPLCHDTDGWSARTAGGAWRPLGLTWGQQPEGQTVERVESGPVRWRWRQHVAFPAGCIELSWEADIATVVVRLSVEQQGIVGGDLRLQLGGLLPHPTHAYWRPHSPAPWRGSRGSVHNRQIYAIPDSGDQLQIGPFYNWERDAASFWSAWSEIGDDLLWLAWIQPSTTFLPAGAQRLDLQVDTDRIDLTIPSQEGRRSLALALLDRQQIELGIDRSANDIDRLHASCNGVGLANLQAMCLDWAGMAQGAFPRLWLDPDQLDKTRQRMRDWDWLHERFVAHVDDELLDTHDAPDMRLSGRCIGRDDAGAYLASGDETYARRALGELSSQLADMVTELLDYGPTCDDNIGISFCRPWRSLVLNLDLILGSANVSDELRREVLQKLAAIAEVQSTDDAWPATGAGIARGNDNFHPDVISARGLAAALLDGHPRQQEWLANAVDEMAAYLDRYHLPSGMSRESATYQFVSLAYALQLHAAAARRGRSELAQLPALRRSLTYLASMQTPVDDRCGHRMLPTVGHVTVHHWCQSLQAIFGWAAQATASTDAEFSAHMARAWRRGGGFVVSLHDYFQGLIWSPPLLMLSPTLSADDTDRDLRSVVHEGFGAVLRARHDDGTEGYVTFKMGPSTGHFDQDEGSFTWYAFGQPMLADFGCQYNPNLDSHPWLHNRISIDHKADGPPRGGRLLHAELGKGVDHVRGEVQVDSLYFHGEWPERDPRHDMRHAGDPVSIPQHVWHRDLLYLHDLEIVILRDRIDGTLPTDFNLQVYADAVDAEGRAARFTGQHGVDLDVFFLAPADPRIQISAFAHQGWDETRLPHFWWRGARWTAPEGTTMSSMAEQALTLRAHAEPGQGYLAVLSARRASERPAMLTETDVGFQIEMARGRVQVAGSTVAWRSVGGQERRVEL